MSQLVVSAIAALVAFYLVHQVIYPQFRPDPPKAVSGATLQSTITAVKQELNKIGGTPGATAGLKLEEVSIELTTQREETESGTMELSVPVFSEASIDAELSQKLTQAAKTTVTFDAPPGEELLDKAPSGFDLSEIVLSVRKALLATLQDPPALLPKSVTIEVNFVLVKSTTAATGFKAHVVSLGTASESVETGGNKITLTYGNDSPKAPK